MPVTLHSITVVYQNPWGEWSPRCYCGWTGTLTAIREHANDQGTRHLQTVAAQQ